MMRYFLYLTFLLSFSKTYGQTKNDLDIGSAAVLIQTSLGSGSGFYIEDTSRKFICLVTACHVLIDLQKLSLYSDTVLFISYKKNSQRDNRDSFKVSLSSAYKNGMLKYDIVNDVAVVKFAVTNSRAINYLPFVSKITLTSTYLKPFETHQVKRIADLETMTDVYTIGYPRSLSLNINFDYNQPLIRHGILAGVDIVKNRIIADCPTYQGNSGGMVFELNKFSGEIFLIGLVSQFVPFEERWKNEAYGYYNTNVYNSGYTVVAPIDAVLNQINQLPN